MKPMLKLMLVLGLCFASTFLVLNLTGLITVDRITHWLELAGQASSAIIGGLVIVLLFADLFVAMPTLTIMILSGFFLGPVAGAACSVVGLTFAGFTGYGISQRYGDRLLKLLIRDSKDRTSMTESFEKYGFSTILLSRAMPILPEVSACMAGLNGMSVSRFSVAWFISTIPYACIAAYAGSISTLSNPSPAILVAIGLTAFFWICWVVFRRSNRQQSVAPK